MHDKTRHIPFAAVPFSFATPVKNFFAALGLCAIVIAGLVPQQVQGQDTAEQTLLLLINDAGLSIERRESGQRSRASESGQNESAVDESAAEPLNRSGALASNHLRQSGTPGEFASMQKAIQAGISGRGSLREAVKQQRESAAYQQQRAVKNIAPRALWYASSGELLRVTRFVDPRVLRAPQRGIAVHEVVVPRLDARFILRGPADATAVEVFLPDLSATIAARARSTAVARTGIPAASGDDATRTSGAQIWSFDL